MAIPVTWSSQALGKTIAIIAGATVMPLASAYADCAASGCTNVAVQSLYVNADGMVYVGTSGSETLLNCAAVSSVYVTLDPTAQNFGAIYAALLAAQMANKLVMIRTAEGSSDCRVLYVFLEQQ